MKKCTNCGGPVFEHKFCPSCGTPVPAVATVAPTSAAIGSATPGPVPPANPILAGIKKRGSALWTDLGRERLGAAAAQAGLVYAAIWALALVFAGLTMLSLSSNESLEIAWAFTLPAQLVGLALGGTFTAGGAAMGISASASMLWVPLTLTAAAAVGVALCAHHAERTHPTDSRVERGALALTTGIVLAIAANVVAAIIPFSVTTESTESVFDMMSSGTISGSAASLTLFLGALVVGSTSSYLARSRVAHRTVPKAGRVGSLFRARVFEATPAILVWGVIMGAVVAITLLIAGTVEISPMVLLSSPLWLPTAVLDGIAFAVFAPLQVSGAVTSFFAGEPTSVWMPTSLPVWAIAIAVIANVLAILLAGTALHVKRAVDVAARSRWLWSIGSFAVLGVAVSTLGSISVTTKLDTSGLGDMAGGLLGLFGGSDLAGAGSSMADSMGTTQGTIGPVPWAFVLFAAIGALVEGVAQFVAPVLLAVLPDRVAGLATSNRVTQSAPSAAAGDGRINTVNPAGDARPVPIEVAPMSPEKRRRIRVIAGVGALSITVVALGAIAIGVVNRVVFSPTGQVESYLTAIVDGDVEAALAIADTDSPASSRVLLTNEVVQSTPDGLTGFTITNTEVAEGQAYVTVQLDQAGSKATLNYRLTSLPNRWLFFNEWYFEPVALPTLAIYLPSGISEIEVNGTAVELTRENMISNGVSYAVFPGTYDVVLGANEKWIQAEPLSSSIRFGGESTTEPVAFEISASDALTDAVTTQVSGWLDTCAASTSLEPEGCPFEAYSWGDAADVVWTLDTEPILELSQASSDEWSVTSSESGAASVTYMSVSEYRDPQAEADDDFFTVSGTVTIVDGEPLFEYSSNGYWDY